MVKRQSGVLAVYAGRPLGSNSSEFALVSVWNEVSDIRAFAGEDWEKSVIPPEHLALIEESYIQHYDLFHSESQTFRGQRVSGGPRSRRRTC